MQYIVTPHDTFTVARMINQSMPISHFMKEDGLITFKVTEKTEDIKGIMGQKRYRDFRFWMWTGIILV